MIPLIFAALVAVTPAPSTADAAPVPWAYAYVPHPEATKTRLAGSPLQGLTPWFAGKAAKKTWIISWPAGLSAPPELNAQPADAPWLPNTGDADMVSRIDLQRALGLVAQGPMGGAASQIIRRLGLDGLQQATKTVTLTPEHLMHTEVAVTVKTPKRGLADALGDAAACAKPGAVPAQALQWQAARVVPAKVWQVIETVAGGMWPLQWGLARTQMDVLEDSLKKQWMQDVLGFAPQTWAFYTVASSAPGHAPDAVAVLNLQEGASAAAFVRETLATAHDLAPSLNVQAQTSDGVSTWTLRGGHDQDTYLAVAGNRLIFASTAAAMKSQVASKGADSPYPDACSTAVAWGVQDDAAALNTLVNGVGRAHVTDALKAISTALGARVLTPKDAFKNLGRSVWFIKSASDGWTMSATSRPAH